MTQTQRDFYGTFVGAVDGAMIDRQFGEHEAADKSLDDLCTKIADVFPQISHEWRHSDAKEIIRQVNNVYRAYGLNRLWF